nr:hypothetical protein [Marinicella sp. W31]MDC2877039.1 hypothetical protein [Marinicella sp. W31]
MTTPDKRQASIRRFYAVVFVASAVIVTPLVWWGYGKYETYRTEQDMIESSPDTPLSSRLILPYGEQPYRLAQKIERGDAISEAEVKALPDGVDKRYGDEITMLFLALQAHNLKAIDTLLAAGADPYIVDRPSQGSARNFAYYVTMPGSPEDQKDGHSFMLSLIQLYLKHGGDPNHRLGGGFNDTVAEATASNKNYAGFIELVRAGADPWDEDSYGDSSMDVLAMAGTSSSLNIINELINDGYFLKIPLKKLQNFMSSLAAYTQRRDRMSEEIQQIALRVLKRNPDYPPDQNTQDIFGGPIPWKEVENAK